MAFGLLDFARRRKLLVVVGVVFGLALIFYFYTVSYRNNSPGDIDVQVSNNAASSLLNKERTSVDTDKPERVKDPPLEEQLKNTPLNKGNIAQAVNELHQVGEGESKGSDYPEHGVEIKPEVGGGHKKSGEHDEKKASKEKKKEGAELEPKTGGKPDSKSDKLVPKSLKDSEIPVKPKSIGVQRLPPQDTVSHSDGAGSYVTDKPQSTDNLYVHSSMPLGPALKIQHTERQKAVVEAFKHAWSNYKKYAWGEDDLRPLSKSHSSVDYGMAMTMIDSLDTLWLLGLQEEFNEARDWVANHLRFDNNPRKVVVFEVNIRVLGGLLSAYHLSGDVMFLAKAIVLGNRLMPAFDTPFGLPTNRVDLQKGLSDLRKHSKPNYGSINIAEAGSLQLEFRDLSRASGDHRYQSAVDRDLDIILESSNNGLYPQYFSVAHGRGSSMTYTVGAGADSFYEYLLKQWVQSNKSESKFLKKYLKSAEAIKNHLVGYTKPNSLPYLGVKTGGTGGFLHNTMEHLACFYPGLLALGLLNDLHPEQRALAEGLTKSCYVAYNSTASGLAADTFMFNTMEGSKRDYARSSEAKNVQRPETIESLFIMYRLTKDKKYREWGWKIFQAFEKNMKVEGGYCSVSDVNRYPAPRNDKMESFFLAETLKYLFLLFGDNDSILSLDEWVFNTEAHPLPIWRNQREPSADVLPGHSPVAV